MSSEIKKIKLKDILEITSSKRIFMSEYVDIGIPFYRSKEIIEKAKGGNISTELFITEDKFNDIEKKFGVPVNGDILLTSVGTIGIPYLIQQNDKFYFKDGNLTWFKNFSNKLYNKFMLYWLQSKDAQNKFDMITIGSTQKALTISSLKELEIPLPSLLTQKKIAHILSTLDDKIELNRKMNQTLEEMAQTIFKSWFVDFDPVHAKANCEDEAELENIAKELGISKEILDLFPSEFIESELGMIPKGWEVINLSEHIEVIKGKSYKSDELQDSKTALVTLKSFLRGGGYRTDGLKPYIGSYKKEQVVKPGEMIIAYTDVTQSADVIGKPAIVLDDENIDIFVASLDVGIVRIKTDDINLMFLYQLFRTPSFQGYILGHTSGTTVLHLSKSWLENFVSFVPNNILMRKFQDITQPLFDKFNENIKQIRALEKTRDTLLPKLLSGEIDVSALEIK